MSNGVLDGRGALITGASQGLGLEIARFFVREGASVCICSRNAGDLEQARSELARLSGPNQRVIAETADVSDAADVARIIGSAADQVPDLSILVSNAGVYGPKGAIWDVDWADWIRALEINLLGSVLIARDFATYLRSAGRRGKIVQLSGGGATSPMPMLSAYAVSKAAVVRFAETLALEVRDDGIDVNAIAPGALNTRMLDEVLAAGPHKVGESFYARAVEQREGGGAPLARGAELAVWLASAASDGITGKLLSALWDPYDEFDAHRADLESDIYTLRRIVPADRGMDWGG